MFKQQNNRQSDSLYQPLEPVNKVVYTAAFLSMEESFQSPKQVKDASTALHCYKARHKKQSLCRLGERKRNVQGGIVQHVKARALQSDKDYLRTRFDAPAAEGHLLGTTVQRSGVSAYWTRTNPSAFLLPSLCLYGELACVSTKELSVCALYPCVQWQKGGREHTLVHSVALAGRATYDTTRRTGQIQKSVRYKHLARMFRQEVFSLQG